MSRMTSSLRPGGTVSDSISVTKPYLYGWRTWDSIPLLIGAPEVLCASQVAETGPWRRRILQELLGIVNQASVDIAIDLLEQALQRRDAHMRQVHRPRQDSRGANRL